MATLVLRLAGIYTLIQVVPTALMFNDTISAALKSGDVLTAAFDFLLVAPFFVVGILLIVCSVPWGKKLAPQNTGEEKTPTISFEQIQTLAFAVAGIVIFAGVLPQLCNSIWFLLLMLHFSPIRGNSYQIALAVGAFLRAALGLWMFFGAHGFANFWRSLRNFGTPQPPQTP